ncbi:adenylosuccinate lyase family protein [Embleya sp. NBC_00888]|uniref:class-II fumarase/aspartase family protein n=1 Tax=Embleya sp. NBC_00888 TaxID=2975960 RepID=UPI003869363C|nr:adenylosuccinate lyase family protein [Embleya sp. NBC_00888]
MTAVPHVLEQHVGARPDIEQDAGLLSPVRVGTPVEAAVCDRAWLQAMLDAEAALARAQARLGTLPRVAAEIITATARAERFDLREVALAARESANPVVALVAALTRAVAEQDPAAAEFVHRGSTSQDILDTGAMLIAARALGIVRTDLTRIADALGALAERYRDTVLAGRTLTLHAVPTTFGLKAAGWRQSVLDARRRIDALLADGLPVSLGGAAGTLAAYLEYAALDDSVLDGSAERLDPGAYIEALVDAFAAETGLGRTPLPWHALRTPMIDLAAVLAGTTGVLGKIAVDVQVLARTEVGEVAEPDVAGRGGSSAMPHKHNPVLSTLIRSAALQVPAIAAALSGCSVAEDERSAGAWHAEWLLLREGLRLAGGAAHTAVELAEGLVVHPERMRANLESTGGHMVTERLAAILTPALGRDRAKALSAAASASAVRTGRSLAEVLAGEPEVTARISAERLAELLDPAGYTGGAGVMVDRALGSPGREHGRAGNYQ